MSSPVDIHMPCGGDAYRPRMLQIPGDPRPDPACIRCVHAAVRGGKCLGPTGWSFTGPAAIEVAGERSVRTRRALDWGDDAWLVDADPLLVSWVNTWREGVETEHARLKADLSPENSLALPLERNVANPQVRFYAWAIRLQSAFDASEDEDPQA